MRLLLRRKVTNSGEDGPNWCMQGDYDLGGVGFGFPCHDLEEGMVLRDSLKTK